MKMFKFSKYALLFVSIIINESSGLNSGLIDVRCDELCSNANIYYPKITGKTPSCERGCRFFNIILLTDGYNISETKKGCHTSCIEAYKDEELNECTLGCDGSLQNMLKILESGNGAFLIADIAILESDNLDGSQIEKDPRNEKRLDFFNCLKKQLKASKLLFFHIFVLTLIIMFIWIVNLLNTRDEKLDKSDCMSKDKSIYDELINYEDYDLDKKQLQEQEEVKIIGFLQKDNLEDLKNPQA